MLFAAPSPASSVSANSVIGIAKCCARLYVVGSASNRITIYSELDDNKQLPSIDMPGELIVLAISV